LAYARHDAVARNVREHAGHDEGGSARVDRVRLRSGGTTPREDRAAAGRQFIYSRNLDEQAHAFTEQVVFPLVIYLQTRLATDSEVLHHLERMRRQIEWFEQATLSEAYLADTGKGEALYDRRVRQFLFCRGDRLPVLSASFAGREGRRGCGAVRR